MFGKAICGLAVCLVSSASSATAATTSLASELAISRDLRLFQTSLGDLQRMEPLPVDIGDSFTFKFTQADGGDFVLPYIPRRFGLNIYIVNGGSGEYFTTDGTLYVKDGDGNIIRSRTVTGSTSQSVSGTGFIDEEIRGPNLFSFREFGGTVTFRDALTRHGAPAFPGAVFAFGYSIGGPAVPEPATWAFFLSGFGLVGSALRAGRRRARVSLP